MLTLTAGCASKPKPVFEEPTPTAPASDVPTEELTLPQVQEEAPPRIVTGSPGKLYTLRARNGELKDVLLAFSKESGENLVVDPDVTGTVTVDLYQVTLEQALETQKRMFSRRDREQTDVDRELLAAVYGLTDMERRFSTDPLTL